MRHDITYNDIITLNERECMVNESTLCLVFDWVDSVNGTTSNRAARLNKMVKKICVGYQQAEIDPSRVKYSPIMVKHSPQL